MARTIDLNADLGESAERWASGEDRMLLDVVTSANVCTGAYAGDDELIAATCAAAMAKDVAIGAQVGYPDRKGFGRRAMEFETEALAAEIARQIAHLRGLAASSGGVVAYVKPHGALYHRVLRDREQRSALEDAAGDLPVLGFAGAGFVWSEGFADRGYGPDGSLIARDQPGALITDPAEASAQAVRLLADGVDSVCVHSDSPGALDIARAVRAALEAAGAEVRHR
ncbi:MAG: LamB/YcsF family protein [Aeromicrobium sp.]